MSDNCLCRLLSIYLLLPSAHGETLLSLMSPVLSLNLSWFHFHHITKSVLSSSLAWSCYHNRLLCSTCIVCSFGVQMGMHFMLLCPCDDTSCFITQILYYHPLWWFIALSSYCAMYPWATIFMLDCCSWYCRQKWRTFEYLVFIIILFFYQGSIMIIIVMKQYWGSD